MFLRRKPTPDASDEELVLALQGGHHSAWGMLWDRYAHLLFGVSMKYLKDPDRSKDAVVDLFAKLPDLLKRHQVECFRPWIHTVMRNHCLLALRGDHRQVRWDDAIGNGITIEPMEGLALHEADLQRLESAIDQLNETQRSCIRLFHLERLSYAQVQERLGIDYDQLRSHLQNGRRNLRLILQQHADQNA
ncbi:MAG: sigma-70 family RNA polymerase sigma factor [Flavobacteriales bacterium]|nr:sigma-70 family RNA polymerase sigma factor [Flavobacteriales bacterium]